MLAFVIKEFKMNWNNVFEYRDGELYWKIKPSNVAKMHVRVGNFVGKKRNYLSVEYKYKSYRIHRIIWEMFYGKIPSKMQIDHIDGNTLNNKVENLRVVDNSDNQKNCGIRKDNKSGFPGVFWAFRIKRWETYITSKGKRYYLGVFKNKEEAIRVRKEAEKKYNFHFNHGRTAS